MVSMLIADSGSTKTQWCLVQGTKKTRIATQGLSPYFLKQEEVEQILHKELMPKLRKRFPEQIHFYGTGCSNPENVKLMKKALKNVFPKAKVSVDHDLMGAARALCGHEKGVACILGTGSNSCFYNGKKIMKNSPGLGYALGDEGSGAYLGKKVLQHYLYDTFDPDLMDRFRMKYNIGINDVLDSVYKKPFPNRYLAQFTTFLVENRGHFMVENIIEDGLNDFFFNHIYKYRESWSLPIHFTGSVAYGFKDVLKTLCASYELTLGKVLKTPLDGLVEFHTKQIK